MKRTRKPAVLIPESARPDVLRRLTDGSPRPDIVHGSGCKEDKTGEKKDGSDKLRHEFHEPGRFEDHPAA